MLDFLGRKIPYCPSGGLSIVDARDAAAAFITALDKGDHQEKYLLGSANMTFAEFFGRLERLSGVSAPLLKMPKKFAVAGSSIIESVFKNWGKASPVATKEVEQAESNYLVSIEKLSRLAEPRMANPATPLLVSYREKLQLLDSSIGDLRGQLEGNRFNTHLRKELLAMYQEKKRTLEEVVKEVKS